MKLLFSLSRNRDVADFYSRLYEDDARLWWQVTIVMYSIYGFDFLAPSFTALNL